jgi:hypothetical protein
MSINILPDGQVGHDFLILISRRQIRGRLSIRRCEPPDISRALFGKPVHRGQETDKFLITGESSGALKWEILNSAIQNCPVSMFDSFTCK